MNEQTSKTKLIYFMSSSVIGGAEKFVETCIDNHSEKYECILFFLNDGPFYKYCSGKYKNVHLTPVKVRLKNPLSWLIFQIYFSYFLFKKRAKLLHATMPYSHLFSALPCKLTRTKNIWFQHGPVGGFLDKLASFLPASGIIFNSKYIQDKHSKHCKVRTANTDIITPRTKVSVSGDEVAKLKKSLFLENRINLLCAGRVCRWKGFENAIKVMSLIRNNSVSLSIIGSPSTMDDKEYELELKELVATLKLENHVRFLGYQDNIHDYIYSADIFIHTSVIPEPFGLVVSEAIALGTYVLGVDLGGVSDQITSKKVGLLYNLEDQKSLQSALEVAIETNTRGIKLISNENVELMINQLEKNYQEIDFL